MREEGLDHWDGSLFVFDGRMASRPSERCRRRAPPWDLAMLWRSALCQARCRPVKCRAATSPYIHCFTLALRCAALTPIAPPSTSNRPALPADKDKEEPLVAAAPCQVCGGAVALPHMNCSNIDCNKLYIACDACKVCVVRFDGMRRLHAAGRQASHSLAVLCMSLPPAPPHRRPSSAAAAARAACRRRACCAPSRPRGSTATGRSTSGAKVLLLPGAAAARLLCACTNY